MVSFIPKDVDGDIPKPLQHRPITVLSCVYRLTSCPTRRDMVATMAPWRSVWCQNHTFSRCPYISYLPKYWTSSAWKASTRRLSYDFEKAFDRVPFRLAVNILRMRGCDEKICRTLDNFYKGHYKMFKIDGHFDQPFVPTNGIIQGCPLSMLILTSLTACWHETLSQHRNNLHPRSYADDLSATIAQPQKFSSKTRFVKSMNTRSILRRRQD